jgi:hypothetical protein
MVFGMTLQTYTILHVVISLVAIASGFVAMFGMFAGKRLNGWTGLFLTTTVATSVTGFGFPFAGVTPGIKLGIISLVLLAIAMLARYAMHLAGAWRWIYVVSALMALYLNVLVGVVQSFEKAPALKALAPTQTEAPFLIAQVVVLGIFIAFTVVAVKKFRPVSA